jgi:hypothetical protein
MTAEEKIVEVAIDQVKGFFYPSAAERAAAYELLIELTTRPSSAPLASPDASIGDELRSIDEMFEVTRTILRKHGTEGSKGSAGNISLAVVALRVLNELFRPVLDRWRPLLDEHMLRRPRQDGSVTELDWERRWERAQSCRAELTSMRAATRSYIETLSHIAGTPAIADAILSAPSSVTVPHTTIDANLHPPATRGMLTPRHKMVRWFDPAEMWRTFRAGARAKDSLDRAAHRTPSMATDGDGRLLSTAEFDAEPDTDFWFDYVADMGDAFDGTAPVAWLMGRRSLHLPDHNTLDLPTPPASMPRAEFVVFGGDEVYPYATAAAYEAQTELPFRMGIEGGPDGSRPTLVAVPGNHDWLGGIEHFEQMFVSNRLFAEHWQTVQTNNWFHVRLPQGWWIWGIDTGLDNELVGPQEEYFRRAADALRAGDRVILCTPVPLWQLRQKHPKAYAHLRGVVDPLIAGRDATMPLCLSGDTHCFAHLERVDTDAVEDHVMAGGGGAFLQPTHNLPERVPLERGNAEFKLTSRWPLPADSRSIAPGAKRLFDPQYWPLMLVAALLQLALAVLADVRTWSLWSVRVETPGSAAPVAAPNADGLSWRQIVGWTLASPWALALSLAIAVAGILAFRGNSIEPKLSKAARVYGFTAGLALSLTLLVVNTTRLDIASLPRWPAIAVAAVLGGILGIDAFLMVVRWGNRRIKAADTLAFLPAHSTRFKHFLRFRIGRDGNLTCYVIGMDPVGAGWYEAMTPADGTTSSVPPYDPAGSPRLHYVWGKTYPKFVPAPLNVAVSISHPDGPPAAARYVSTDAFDELSAALIDRGHTVVYGGAPGRDLTERLGRIDRARHADDPNARPHVVNYVADHLWDDHTGESSDLLRVRARPGAVTEGSTDSIVVANLSAMRRQMTQHADVRIVIGGALRPGAPGTRLAPGVVEEAYLALDAGIPLIIAGGFGGAAELMADALIGRLDPRTVDTLDEHFLAPETEPGTAASVQFREMLWRFTSVGVLRNGLTDGENLELLHSSRPDTVTTLILRSIHRIGGGRYG